VIVGVGVAVGVLVGVGVAVGAVDSVGDGEGIDVGVSIGRAVGAGGGSSASPACVLAGAGATTSVMAIDAARSVASRAPQEDRLKSTTVKKSHLNMRISNQSAR
jgi:hypothetical protein